MADLVTLTDLKALIGDAPASADDALLTALLNDVEALYEAATLRPPGFYTAAASGRTEVLDGTGSARLRLAYPISAITSIKLGYDPAAPTETLAVANKLVVVYGVGERIITRTDGGKFGTVGQARYVQVVYDHLGNLSADASLAIKSVCIVAYRRRGSEDVKSETLGAFYSHTMLDDIAAGDPWWKIAVESDRPVVMA